MDGRIFRNDLENIVIYIFVTILLSYFQFLFWSREEEDKCSDKFKVCKFLLKWAGALV